MRRILLSLFLAISGVCCVDSGYDLSKIDTEAAIGGTETVFEMPLTTVVVGAEELLIGERPLRHMLDELAIWLPSELPDGADHVDIPRMRASSEYVDQLLGALFEEMKVSDEKVESVAGLVYDRYLDHFYYLIPGAESADRPVFLGLFKHFLWTSESLREELYVLASKALASMEISPLKYEIPRFEVGQEVVDMLALNLDSKETTDPKNTLFLYGSVDCGLPVSFSLTLSFLDTDICIGPVLVPPGGSTEFDAFRLFSDDIRFIMSGVILELESLLENYYPAAELNPERDEVVISLHVRKQGGLTFDF